MTAKNQNTEGKSLAKLSKIWLNGKYIDWDKANIHVLSHALHYGTSVFEGIRCYEVNGKPKIFRLKEHIDRLFYSADIMKIKIPYSKSEVIEAANDLIKINKVKSCYIRPIVFLGYGVMGLDTRAASVDVAIAAWPWGAYLGEGGVEKGIKICVCPYIRQINGLSKGKIGGAYYESILAKRHAIDNACDEALMLDSSGFIAEGSGENIFLVKNNKFNTPKVGAILPGITRAEVIKIIKANHYTITEENIKLSELKNADEAFFTGTAAEITPIVQVDKVKIADGKVGNLTKKIRELFFEKVNE